MRVAAIALLAMFAVGCGAASNSTSKKSTRVIFESTSGGSISDAALESVVEVMRKRLDELGVEDAQVEREGNRIAVILPDRRIDLKAVKEPGRLEFFDLQGDLVADVSLDEDGNPVASRKPLQARPNTVVVTCGPPAGYCPGLYEEPRRNYYYLFKYRPDDKAYPIPELTGEDLERKGTRQDFDPSTNEPVVLMEFTRDGAKKFERITATLAKRGAALYNKHIGEPEMFFQQFAIVLDGDLKSAPTIDFQQNPNGIPGDAGAEITGVSVSEGKDLALVLRSGTLPFTLRVVSVEPVT